MLIHFDLAKDPSHYKCPQPSVACHVASSRHAWSTGSCRKSPGRTKSSTWATKRPSRTNPRRWRTPATRDDDGGQTRSTEKDEKDVCAKECGCKHNVYLLTMFHIYLYYEYFFSLYELCVCAFALLRYLQVLAVDRIFVSANSGAPWVSHPQPMTLLLNGLVDPTSVPHGKIWQM